jgi:two-component system, OmpR family, KDP operon response regulator KdpE
VSQPRVVVDGPHPPAVLVIEDDPQVRRFLRNTLPPQGYRLYEAATGAEGLSLATQYVPDLLLLDLGLPDLDGVEVIARLRAWSAMPIVVISARELERQKIEALDAGADDFLTKPFGFGELLARLRVALRHAARREAEPSTVFSAGPLHVDLGARRVRVDAAEVHLTPLEFKLLAVLVRHAGRVVMHKQLLEAVWGPRSAHQTHYVRVHMMRLRRKLGRRLFTTEPGVGYRLVDWPPDDG